MESHKRRELLINPSFQYRIIGWMTALALAPISAFFFAHFYFFRKLRLLGEEIQLSQDDIYFRFIEGLSQDLFYIFLVCAILTVIVVFTFGLRLSHKIAGPIFNLKNYLTTVGKGQDTGELSFRKDDFFNDLPEVVNESVRALKERK